MAFQFHMPVTVVFEVDAIKRLNDLCRDNEVMLMTDNTLVKLGVADKVLEQLKRFHVTVFSDIEPNPSEETVNKAAAVAREKKVGCVVALGGGSVMDAAKAVAALALNEGELRDYLGGKKQFANGALQLICIPTTSGTGSEVTNVGVFCFDNGTLKTSIVCDEFWAETALIDPMMTISVPPKTTVSTGLDALCHAIECYWSTAALPPSDGMAMAAVKKILDNLEIVYKDGSNVEARGEMAIASVVAGMAFSQTRTTACHAISYPLTTDYHVDHGTACALTLIPVLERVTPHLRTKMDDLARYCGLKDADDLIAFIKQMCDNINAPLHLSPYGVKEEGIDELVKNSFKAAIIHNIPGDITEPELAEMLRSIL